MKKILVLSHNSFSKTQNNGKTLESFFQECDKDNIAQIYLQPEWPDFEFCKHYYRMTDYEALNSAVFGGSIGHVLKKTHSNNEFIGNANGIVKGLYLSKRNGEPGILGKWLHVAAVNRLPLIMLSREILWRFSKWNTKKLQDWIKNFAPDVLFFQGSSCAFAYRIALWISSAYKIPLVLQLTDDYTVRLYKFSIFEFFYKKMYINAFKDGIKKAYKVVAISKYMCEEYSSKFGGNYITLMNSIYPYPNTEEPNDKDLILMYAGNVLLNRWKVLKKIGEVLSSINAKSGTSHKLRIYSPTDIPIQIKNKLKSVDAISCDGRLGPAELAFEISQSNILVHVESFDKRMIKITRLSISTKIPEYLSSRRCILAVGPKELASIRHLNDNNLACVVSSNNSECIKAILMQLIASKNQRSIYSMNAFGYFVSEHHPDKNKMTIKKLIQDSLIACPD